MDKVKILELCHFSSGVCGVWSRVSQEARMLSDKGYEVNVFSSNSVKGSKKIVPSKDKIGNVKISRFPSIKLGGESFMYWNCFSEALKYSPDVIIAHVYRHPHTTLALKIKKALMKSGKNCIVFLVSHAPFNADNSERGILSSISVKFYDKFIGNRVLNKFDKILTISNWEINYLLRIGARKDKLFYLPNGVSSEFFKSNYKMGNPNKILFLGRIAPVKNLEAIIGILPKIDKRYILELVGPTEKSYSTKLRLLAKKLGMEKRTIFSPPIYKLKEKIAKLDSSLFFILPSKREGMPQSLIEAMSRGRICIGSNVDGIKDLIKNNKNGFILDSPWDKKLNNILSLSSKKLNIISNNARSFAHRFNWNIIIYKLDKLIKEQINKKI